MDRFVAPQFIDVEDRIIGPITTRQFILLVIGGVIAFLSYKLLDTAGFALTSIIVLGVVALLGFVKINGRRFHEFIGSMVETLRKPKIRVWCKKVSLSDVKAINEQPLEDGALKTAVTRKRKIRSGSLKELSLLVDTGGRYKMEGNFS